MEAGTGSAVSLIARVFFAWGLSTLVPTMVGAQQCADDLIVLPPITVGCELVDCCPWCPRVGELSWRVSYDSDRQAELGVRLVGLTPRQIGRVQIGPGARWVSNDQVVISAGEVVLGRLTPDGGSTFGELTLRLHAAAVPPRKPARISVRVDQLLGEFVVASSHFAVTGTYCEPNPVRGDRITLVSHAPADQAVLMLDVNQEAQQLALPSAWPSGSASILAALANSLLAPFSGGCRNDAGLRTSVTRLVPNYLSVTGTNCRSEIVVFSDDNAIRLYENVDEWTDDTGDLFVADMSAPRWQVPISIWIAVPAADTLERRIDAENDLRKADELFNASHAGIGLLEDFRIKVLDDAASKAIVGETVGRAESNNNCEKWAPQIRQEPSVYDSDRINVYYFDDDWMPTDRTGRTCLLRQNDTLSVVGIYSQSNLETLAHELGHVFGLYHVTEEVAGSAVSKDYDADGEPDFDKTNLMWPEVPGRTHFTEGQGFRMTFHSLSDLNEGFRTEPNTRDCTDDADTGECPRLVWNR